MYQAKKQSAVVESARMKLLPLERVGLGKGMTTDITKRSTKSIRDHKDHAEHKGHDDHEDGDVHVWLTPKMRTKS